MVGCGGTLSRLRRIHAASGVGVRLCAQLEDLGLCFSLGPTVAEEVVLAEFAPRAIKAWVRGCAIPLKKLTVLTQAGSDLDSDSDADDSISECRSDAVERTNGQRDGVELARDAEFADSKLWRDLGATMKLDTIGGVFLATMNCPTCSVEHEPLDSVGSGDGGLTEGVTYYYPKRIIVRMTYPSR